MDLLKQSSFESATMDNFAKSQPTAGKVYFLFLKEKEITMLI
jgi:hypothetical protein